MKMRLILWMMIGFCFMQAKANNVRITDQVKVAGRLGQDTIILSFPLKWDNSWRLDENWDAVYLFIKYKRLEVEEPWRHLCVKSNGHRVDPGYTWSVAQTRDDHAIAKPEPSNAGLFVFRNSTGVGAASTMVRIAVDISQGDLEPYYRATYDDFKNGKIDISVAAIEMVFVPRGPYYLGDGISYNTFTNEQGEVCLVTSENPFTLKVKDGNEQTLKPDAVQLKKLYPKGYEGFYCMKYEISQEQYVYFLNKLPYREQKKRIGNDLDKMSPGDYAFTTKSYPEARNGIILEKRKTAGLETTGNHGDTAVIFGHNLNQEDGYNSPKDGKTVACNFLTPEDAWAYADWVGLRLMTELEYEKACRLRNPSVAPTTYQYAWNGMTLNPPSSGLATGTEGSVYEMTTGDANANVGVTEAGKVGIQGPLRCGSFAREGTTFMSTTGASFWGALDLTGNLSEMVCNTVGGLDMVGIEGDGSLNSEVISWSKDTVIYWYGTVGVPPYTNHVTVYRSHPTRFTDRWGQQIMIRDSFVLQTGVSDRYYSQGYGLNRTVVVPVKAWPDTLLAYGVKGGSYKDTDWNNLSVSGRKEVDLFKAGINLNPALTKSQRLPYVTFRLVRSVPVQQIKAGRIGLQNNEFKDTAILCTARPYVIKELDAGSTESSAILYEWEEDAGSGWVKLEGETNQTLALTNHWNIDTVLQSRQYRRKSVTPLGEGYSNAVTLTLVGQPKFLPLQSSIDDCNLTRSITGSVKVVADSILWLRADNNALLGTKEELVASSVYVPNRSEYPGAGEFEIYCKAYLQGCAVSSMAYVTVKAPAGADDCPSTVTDDEGNTYRAGMLADCRCWLLEPLKKVTDYSVESPDHIQMYNFRDIAGEYPSDNTVTTSNLCPEGFYIPTEYEVANLIGNLQGLPAPQELKGDQPYGCYSEGDDFIPGYYWAVIYAERNDQLYEIECNVMSIDENGYLQVGKEFRDTDGYEWAPNGGFYFPIRCIKANPNKK